MSWEAFFDEQAATYAGNEFAQFTEKEVAFLLELLKLRAGSTILDVGCGNGRHSIELAKRGFKVTGVDFSRAMLEEARKSAAQANVSVTWIHANARDFESDILFDAAICLCEGGIGLADADQDPVVHDLSIIKRIYAALRPNADFVMTALNGYATIRQMTDDHVKAGAFDPASMLSAYEDEWVLPSGPKTMQIRERLFIAPEMVSMLRHVGFSVLNVWGGTAGDWGQRPLKLDEVETMFYCRKL